MSNHQVTESCVSYLTCGLALHIQEINWTTIGAVVLLIARLLSDVPAAYDSVVKLVKRYKEWKAKRVKGDR